MDSFISATYLNHNKGGFRQGSTIIPTLYGDYEAPEIAAKLIALDEDFFHYDQESILLTLLRLFFAVSLGAIGALPIASPTFWEDIEILPPQFVYVLICLSTFSLFLLFANVWNNMLYQAGEWLLRLYTSFGDPEAPVVRASILGKFQGLLVYDSLWDVAYTGVIMILSGIYVFSMVWLAISVNFLGVGLFTVPIFFFSYSKLFFDVARAQLSHNRSTQATARKKQVLLTSAVKAWKKMRRDPKLRKKLYQIIQGRYPQADHWNSTRKFDSLYSQPIEDAETLFLKLQAEQETASFQVNNNTQSFQSSFREGTNKQIGNIPNIFEIKMKN